MLAFGGFLAFFGAMIFLGLPVEYQILSTFDFAFMTGSIIGISGACVIATGLPCAIALVVFGLISLFTYIIVSIEIIKLLIILPLIFTFIYIIARLGRGGG